jgi:CheY-like chemotaxis protein
VNRTILLVEDEESDRLFLKLAFEEIGLGQCLCFVTDGQQALDYLSGKGDFEDRDRYPLPYLVLLDINLPHLTGLQVLKWMRDREKFRSIIVIPLTSSNHPADQDAARRFGANDYLVKPVGLAGWRGIARRVKDLWLPQIETSCASNPGKPMDR